MKVEIDIRDDIKPDIALECVKQVVASGKISRDGKGKLYYCWITTFGTPLGKIIVFTRGNRKNDCFVVSKDKNKQTVDIQNF